MNKWLVVIGLILVTGCWKDHTSKSGITRHDTVTEGCPFIISATNGWTGYIMYESNKVSVGFNYYNSYPLAALKLDGSSLSADITFCTPTNSVTTVIGAQGLPLYRLISTHQGSGSYWQVYSNGSFITPERKSNSWWIGKQKVSMQQLLIDGGKFQ